MPTYQELMNLISDPFNGPFEGEDFCIDQDGIIQVSDNNVKIAAMLMRKANSSGIFPQNLVKIGQKGDTILLGFDSLADSKPVFQDHIGYKRDSLAEVKVGADGKFCIYINKKRGAKQFTKLSQARAFIKRLDKSLEQEAVEPEVFEDQD